MDYMYSKPEKRDALLATTIRKLLKLEKDYYDMEYDIREFAIDKNIHHTEVRLTDINYPEELDW